MLLAYLFRGAGVADFPREGLAVFAAQAHQLSTDIAFRLLWDSSRCIAFSRRDPKLAKPSILLKPYDRNSFSGWSTALAEIDERKQAMFKNAQETLPSFTRRGRLLRPPSKVRPGTTLQFRHQDFVCRRRQGARHRFRQPHQKVLYMKRCSKSRRALGWE